MLKNVGSNWALNIVQILVFMVLTRFVVNILGKGTYGVWETVVALAGPLQLLILGVPMASVRYISEFVARGDVQGANRAVSTCLAITALMGLVALVAGAVLFLAFEQYVGSERWNLSPAEIVDARIAFGVVVATLAVGFVIRLPYGIYDAHHDFIPRNLVMASGFLVKLALTVLLLSWRVSLTALAAVQLAAMLVEFAVAMAVSRRRHPGIRFSLGSFDRSMVKGVLSFSVFSMLLNMGAILAFRLDALVIGAFRDEEAVMVYGIGNKIFEPFLSLVLAIGMVVMPMATALMARNEVGQLRPIFLKWSKVCTSLVLLLGTYLLVFGPEFLRWWIGGEYDEESGRLLQVLMVSFIVFLPVRGVALPILMGLGKPRRPAIGLLVMGLLNLGLSIALIGPYGLLGVALGTAIPNVLFALFVLATACAELRVGMGEFLGRVVGRAAVGIALPLALLLALKSAAPVEGFWPLFSVGIGFVALFGAVWVLFVYKGDPDLDLHAKLVGRLRGGSAS